jgi:hypothetical protein
MVSWRMWDVPLGLLEWLRAHTKCSGTSHSVLLRRSCGTSHLTLGEGEGGTSHLDVVMENVGRPIRFTRGG